MAKKNLQKKSGGGEGGSKEKPVQLRKDGRVGKCSFKEARKLEELIMKLKKLPIFNDQLIDKEWFLGYPIGKLIVFVETVKRAVKEHMHRERSKDVWDLVTQNLKETTADENKELWEQLIKELPEPTVQDTLNTCKQFICYRLGLIKMRKQKKQKKPSHKDWPKDPPRINHFLREEASVLGKTQIPNKYLWDNLTPIGSSILEIKYQEHLMSHFIDVVEFLKKHPEDIPLKSMEIYEPPCVYL